jgi:hypothetical protein
VRGCASTRYGDRGRHSADKAATKAKRGKRSARRGSAAQAPPDDEPADSPPDGCVVLRVVVCLSPVALYLIHFRRRRDGKDGSKGRGRRGSTDRGKAADSGESSDSSAAGDARRPRHKDSKPAKARSASGGKGNSRTGKSDGGRSSSESPRSDVAFEQWPDVTELWRAAPPGLIPVGSERYKEEKAADVAARGPRVESRPRSRGSPDDGGAPPTAASDGEARSADDGVASQLALGVSKPRHASPTRMEPSSHSRFPRPARHRLGLRCSAACVHIAPMHHAAASSLALRPAEGVKLIAPLDRLLWPTRPRWAAAEAALAVEPVPVGMPACTFNLPERFQCPLSWPRMDDAKPHHAVPNQSETFISARVANFVLLKRPRSPGLPKGSDSGCVFGTADTARRPSQCVGRRATTEDAERSSARGK